MSGVSTEVARKRVAADDYEPQGGLGHLYRDLWSLWAIVAGIGTGALIGMFDAWIRVSKPAHAMLLLGCLALALVGWLARHPDTRTWNRLRKKGVARPAAVVQANMRLWDAPDGERWAAVVVFSFAPELGDDPAALQELASRLFALKAADRTQLPGELRPVAWSLANELPCHPRVPVPASFAGAPETFIASVDLLPEAVRGEEGLHVLALRDDDRWTAACVVPPGSASSTGSQSLPRAF